MSNLPPKLAGDWLSNASSVALFAMFEQANYTARFVGGVVRNTLMDQPVGDLDIAADARPEMVMSLASKAGFKTIATGLDHGTVTVIVGEHVYEITTLRVDVETDGRHAEVSFTKSWHEDAARRDFTMNALYVDPDGTLFDPLGGYEDLLARQVRFIGEPDDRIREDYLRILRFFRFSAQYGKGALDPPGLAACVRLQKGLASLSAERIRSELMRALLAPAISPVVEQMFSHGLLLPIIFRVPHQSRFNKWLALENELKRTPFWIDRLGALTMLAKEDADSLSQRLRLSGKEKHALANWAGPFEVDENTSEQQARIFSYRNGMDYQLKIAIAWVCSGAEPDSKIWRSLYDLSDRWQPAVFPLKGQDLIEAGMTPGPSVGKKLLELERIWIESDFNTGRDELLSYLNTAL